MLAPRPLLRSPVCLILLALACGESGGDDELAGESESGSSASQTETSDAGTSEAGTGESGTTEASTTESSTTEASTTEASTTSSETDTGALDCTSDSMPIGGTPLIEWLAGVGYEGWPAETGPHASTGPHFGTVRTFVNPCMFDSLDAGAATHPVGAVAVKELYGNGNEVEGYSVMIKVAAGEGGDTWYWLESYQGTTYADEAGSGLCTGCHGAPGNRDYFLSPWPLQ